MKWFKKDKKESQTIKAPHDVVVLYLRLAFVVFGVFYAAFALTDRAFFPDSYKILYVIRFGVIIPMFAVTYVLTYTTFFQKHHQWIMSSNLIVGGLGIVVMLVMDPNNFVYYGGLFMVFFSGYFILQLRFVYATITGLALLASLIIANLIFNYPLSTTVLSSIFFFFGANGIGMIGSYNLERMHRENYIQHMTIVENQKLAQSKLMHAFQIVETRYQTVNEASSTGIWEYHMQEEYVWCSPEYFSILGYHEDEFPKVSGNIKEVWHNLIHPDDIDVAVDVFDKYITNKPDALYENSFRMRCKNGKYRWIGSRGSFLKSDTDNKNIIVGTHIDISNQKQKETEITHISYHDYTTKIPNRRHFSEKLEELDNSINYPLAIMMMDINGLKMINDAFGHENGDLVLINVANILQMVAKNKYVIARIGGDEFAMILPKAETSVVLAEKQKIEKLVANEKVQNVSYSISIGFSIKRSRSESLSEAIKTAEEDMYKNKVLEGKSMRSRAIHGILSTLTEKYEEERIHSERVADYAYAIGQCLNLNKENLSELKLAGMLHDIGKISIPDAILAKPGILTEDEWEIMRKHTLNGYNILRAADDYSNLALYALTHHEHIDGSGYPKGLKEREIPLFSRIIHVADAYEAMTSDRPYRKAMEPKAAVNELIRFANVQFDADIVEIFINKVLGVAKKE